MGRGAPRRDRWGADRHRTAVEVLAGGVQALTDAAPAEQGPGITVTDGYSYEQEDELAVTVPRFTVSARHDLLQLPQVFGLKAATDTGQGHFPGLSRTPLAVTDAAQSAMAGFQADGFEAAAATALGLNAAGRPPQPPHRVKRIRLTIDRPFGFLAGHRPSGLILTTGWIAEPQRQGGITI